MTFLLRLTEKRPDRAIDSAVQAAISQAVALYKLPFEGQYPLNGIGIAALSARSVSASNQVSGLASNVLGTATWGIGTSIAASTWTDWINLAIDDRIYVVWTGITHRSAEPKIIALGPSGNGQELPNVDITQMYTWNLAQAYLSKPLVISPGNNFTIRILSPTAIPAPLGGGDTIEKIGLLGYIVGKKTYLIAES